MKIKKELIGEMIAETREEVIGKMIEKTREEVLDKMIEETLSLFDYHLQEMTKFEQRMNVLKSFRTQEVSISTLN